MIMLYNGIIMASYDGNENKWPAPFFDVILDIDMTDMISARLCKFESIYTQLFIG